VFVTGNLFIMFVGKAEGLYLNRAPERGLSQVGSGLACKH